MRRFEVVVTIRGRAFRYEVDAPNQAEARRLTAEKHGCPLGATYVMHRGSAVAYVTHRGSAVAAATAGAHFIERLQRLGGRWGGDSSLHASTSAAQRSRSRPVERKRVASAPPFGFDRFEKFRRGWLSEIGAMPASGRPK
jgi:hypothetical protein